ncbi:MAG: hypothetical protein JWO51_109 [Rhodospirillales bacterium]|nr:hypothetical protein [Rhodospirillales bacterium]
MTTKNSPIAKLRAQALKIAKTLKDAECGKATVPDPGGKLAASLAKGEVTVGVAMDDKIIQITMPWATVRETDEAGLVEFILVQMREEAPAH